MSKHADPPAGQPEHGHAHDHDHRTGKSDRLWVGALLGAIATAALLGAVLWTRWPKPQPALPPFLASRTEVTLRKDLPQPITFETAEVKSAEPLPLPPITARVVAVESRTAPSFAPLDGRIDHVAVRLGEHVAAGAHLALVRSGDLAGMLKDLRASIAHAQTKRALAERMKLLVEARGASANDLLVAQNDLRDAELTSRAADSRMKSLAIASDGDNLYWLLAPRPGVVVQIDATPGQQVGPNKDRPVATIADLDEVLVLADVPQQDVGEISAQDPVEIATPGDNVNLSQGQVDSVSQVVDPERQTVPIRIRVKNDQGRLRPNAFVQARFRLGHDDAHARVLQVPSDAVVSDGLQAVVFVQVEPGRFRRTQVAVGRQKDRVTEIRSGLHTGDRVVTSGALLLLNALEVQE